jgi:hypothetical protein
MPYIHGTMFFCHRKKAPCCVCSARLGLPGLGLEYGHPSWHRVGQGQSRVRYPRTMISQISDLKIYYQCQRYSWLYKNIEPKVQEPFDAS